MAEFFYMGGYAFHVWTCWGLSFVLLGGLAITRRRKLRHIAELARNMDVEAKAESTSP
ncbi:MAG: heme exporter protein CcmD [Hyphomonadaceae bacterium]